MNIPKIDMMDNETGCCPRFHPEDWDDRVFTLKNEKFAKASSKSFLYMPLNFGKVMSKSMESITASEALPEDTYLILSRDVSKWRCEHHFMVTKDVENMEMVYLEGDYYTKTFDGPFKMMPEWIKSFKALGDEKGYDFKDILYFYTTCPKCAQHYGHNFVVMFGRVK